MRGKIGLRAAIIATALAWNAGMATAEDHTEIGPDVGGVATQSRVRPMTPHLSALVAEASQRSTTFHNLVTRIDDTDGVVYLVEQRCGVLNACLLHAVRIAGPNRLLQINVDARKTDSSVMASIGHELQHVVEVLSDPTIRSAPTMRLFYRLKCSLCGKEYETDAAVRAGLRIGDELRSGPTPRTFARRQGGD